MSSPGSRIQEVRGEESRASFAKKVKISPVTLERYEKDKYPIPEKFISFFAALFGLSVDWLLTGEGEKYVQNDKIIKQNEYMPLNDLDEVSSSEFLKEQVKMQREQIETLKQNAELAKMTADALRRENDTLREQNETLKRQAKILEDLLEAERRRTRKAAMNDISAAG